MPKFHHENHLEQELKRTLYILNNDLKLERLLGLKVMKNGQNAWKLGKKRKVMKNLQHLSNLLKPLLKFHPIYNYKALSL